eukprot:3004346-Prymnesium_polylepis.1
MLRWAEGVLRHAHSGHSRALFAAGYLLIGDPDVAPRTPLAAQCPFLCIATPPARAAAAEGEGEGETQGASYEGGDNMLMFAEALELRF